MNIPNTLTIFRIILTFIFIFSINQVGLQWKLISFFIFVIASISDFLDGYYAKKFNMITGFGKIMDPIADKFLMLSAFFVFMKMDIIALWIFIVIFCREVLITGSRLFAVRQGRILAAEKMGKYKTVSQMVLAIIILIYLILKDAAVANKNLICDWMRLGIDIIIFVTVILTVVSGILYFYNNRKPKNV